MLFEKKKRPAPFCQCGHRCGGQRRAYGGRDKIFANLGGVPVLARTLRAFQNSPYISEIVVVVREERLADAAGICREYGITKASKVIRGGAKRVHSVYGGVLEVSPMAEYVAVHDGARPLVSEELIEAAVASALEAGASGLPFPSKIL
jgi:2-C-methyl-D-erythritol 4-phosphate cytidylyltransferase